MTVMINASRAFVRIETAMLVDVIEEIRRIVLIEACIKDSELQVNCIRTEADEQYLAWWWERMGSANAEPIIKPNSKFRSLHTNHHLALGSLGFFFPLQKFRT